MKSRHEHVNSFEVAVVGMIVLGFILIGGMLLTSLTPRTQTHVDQALNMFDLHEEVAQTVNSTVSGIDFVMDVQQEFYNQFYIAFVELTTLPDGALEAPVAVASEFSRNISVAVNNITSQLAQGYAGQNNIESERSQNFAQAIEPAATGQVAGAVIDLSDKISNSIVSNNLPVENIQVKQASPPVEIPYHYSPPDMNLIKMSLTKLINQ